MTTHPDTIKALAACEREIGMELFRKNLYPTLQRLLDEHASLLDTLAALPVPSEDEAKPRVTHFMGRPFSEWQDAYHWILERSGLPDARSLADHLDRIEKSRVAASAAALPVPKQENDMKNEGVGIAQAPDEAKPCAHCGNENLCVEVRTDKYPGMTGFSVRCGYAFCGARGPVRVGQMDAVAEWNKVHDWYAVKPSAAALPGAGREERYVVSGCDGNWRVGRGRECAGVFAYRETADRECVRLNAEAGGGDGPDNRPEAVWERAARYWQDAHAAERARAERAESRVKELEQSRVVPATSEAGLQRVWDAMTEWQEKAKQAEARLMREASEAARLRSSLATAEAERDRLRGAIVDHLRENDVRPGGLGSIGYTMGREHWRTLGNLYCAAAGIEELPQEPGPAFYISAPAPRAEPVRDAEELEASVEALRSIGIPASVNKFPAPYAEERDTFHPDPEFAAKLGPGAVAFNDEPAPRPQQEAREEARLWKCPKCGKPFERYSVPVLGPSPLGPFKFGEPVPICDGCGSLARTADAQTGREDGE